MQSTCTTPYLEAENICVQNMQDISRLKCGNASNLSNTDMERHEECTKMDEESVMLEIEEGGKLFIFFHLYVYLEFSLLGIL